MTQKKVLEGLETITKPTITNDASITDQKIFTPSQEQLDQKDAVTALVTGATDSTAGERSAWSSAMSSGWFSPITFVGCTPFTSTFAGKTWVLDHCPIAAKISEIGSYAAWFMLLVGVFVMVTQQRNVEA